VSLTNVEHVYLNYKQPNQEKLEQITISDAKKYLAEGQFPPGNMGPKIEAAINFLENGGEEVIITSLDKAKQAILGNAGTRIVCD
jgi:carbamate kinase